MDRVPDYYPDISRRLSQVLDDIGVNERTVNVRRRTGLLVESMMTLSEEALDRDLKCYRFGSQTEGTTTLGLNSDTDVLDCYNKVNVIKDWREWKCDKMNLLMIQDDTTPPGHCRLQMLQSDIPVAREDIPSKHFEYDDERRVLMKNTHIHQHVSVGIVRHGPAGTHEDTNLDIVHAISCRNWPSEADEWILRYYAKKPLNINLIRHSVQSGCFVVPTREKTSPNERLEWRISTSMAESYLMFNMNITQIRCYVLLKMIIKKFITSNFPDTISSYHCKTVLMYLVENSQNELWQEEKLLLCVTLCLRLLHSCICANNCPHYFIPGNNLMAGRFDVRTRQQLLEVAIQNAIYDMKTRLSALLSAYMRGGDIERDTSLLIIPSLCTTIGSLLASYNISQGQSISNNALSFLSLGIDSDVAAGRLKLASALFCAGYLDRTSFVLRNVEKRYNPLATETICGCRSTECNGSEWRFPIDSLHIDNINCLRSYFAFGVSFSRGEIHCVPQALRYEMFRLTEEEEATRDKVIDYWMDWAVVDSLPYLYYLQYLTYGRLGRQIDQQRALDKLIETIITESDLYHRETALNLLGQCMEAEDRLMDALACYICSLNERPTHNVARWHISILLGRIYNLS